MTISFMDERTREFAKGKRVKAFAGIRREAEMKLDQLEAASSLTDLNLPGNHLKALKGTRECQYSIRVNGQWRICFDSPLTQSEFQISGIPTAS